MQWCYGPYKGMLLLSPTAFGGKRVFSLIFGFKSPVKMQMFLSLKEASLPCRFQFIIASVKFLQTLC